MLITKGTRYDCNLGHEEDLIWLQSWAQKGLDMIAMSVLNRTTYDCNLCQKGHNMIAIIENLFWRDSSRNHSHVTPGRFSTLQFCPFWKRLQSYLVPFLVNIEIIFGPYHKNYCNHKWSTPITIGNIWIATS